MEEKRYTKIIWRCCAKYWTAWNSEKSSGRSGARTQDRPVTCQCCGKAASLASHAFGVEPVELKNKFSFYRQFLQMCLFYKKNNGRSGIRTQDRPVMSRLLWTSQPSTAEHSEEHPNNIRTLSFANKPRMSEKDIPESIRIGQSKYVHAIPRRWRFIWAGFTMQHHKSQSSHSST